MLVIKITSNPSMVKVTIIVSVTYFLINYCSLKSSKNFWMNQDIVSLLLLESNGFDLVTCFHDSDC